MVCTGITGVEFDENSGISAPYWVPLPTAVALIYYFHRIF
jgi:hypothetical protein